MAAQSDAGASPADPRFEPAGIGRLEVHRDRSGPIRGAAPVTTTTDVTEGRLGARDDRAAGPDKTNKEVNGNGIA